MLTKELRNHADDRKVVQSWCTKGNWYSQEREIKPQPCGNRIFSAVYERHLTLYNISTSLWQGSWRFWCWIHTTHTRPFILCNWSCWKPALWKTCEANSIPRILSHVWILLWLRPPYFSGSANTKCTTTSSSLSRSKWWTNFPQDVSSCCLLAIIQYPSPVS